MLKNGVFYGTKNDNMKRNTPKNIQRKLNNVQLLVVRIGGNSKKEFVNSKPCVHCINYMKQLGIKKIYYSDNFGNIIYEKIQDIQTDHVSIIRLLYQNNV